MSIVLLAAGCTSRHPAAPARPPAASSTRVPGAAPIPDLRALAERYLAIATAGNRRLETDFDRLNGPDHGHLAAARADLRDAAATERLFDQHVLAIAFPPQTETVAQGLFAVNEARANLTAAAAGSTSLHRLRQYETALTTANAPVERAVTTIRSQLSLPLPATS